MKKVITITICICLIFSSVVPSYAATDNIQYFLGSSTSTRIDAYTAFNTIISYLAILTNHSTLNQQFLTLDGDGNNPANYYSFQDVAQDIRNIAVDVTLSTSSGAYTIKELLELINYSNSLIDTNTAITASTVSSINSYLLNDQDAYLSQLSSNIYQLFYSRTPTFFNPKSLPSKPYPYWTIRNLDNQTFGSTYMNTIYNWSSGHDMLDFIANVLAADNKNFAIFDEHLLLDVDSQLSIWDSQGDSLSQELWIPTSGFNGLYKYLAYTQRDVARLTHVLASDYEIEARDNVQDLQESFNDQFLDPDSDGAISTDDIEGISGLSGGIKENISTNANASGIFDIFNSDHGGWFSQETANELDTSTPQNRGDRNADTTYPTPLLDERINEIYNALGVNNND